MVKIEIRVIYGDTDQMGVVYYANYLRYFESGRNEYLRAVGLRYRDFERELGLVLPVVEAHVDYKQPARYDDLLVLETSLTRVLRASARFDYRILRDTALIATGHTLHACLTRAGKIRKLPDQLKILLEAQDVSPGPPAGGRAVGWLEEGARRQSGAMKRGEERENKAAEFEREEVEWGGGDVLIVFGEGR